MLDFIRSQADFVILISSISFLAVGSICLSPARSRQARLPWKWLGLFGLTYGLFEAFNLVVLDLGDSHLFELAHVCVKAASFIFLLEFGRSGYVAVRGNGPGKSIIAPLAGIVFLCGLIGVSELQLSINLLLGVVGAVWSALTLILESRASSRSVRYCLVVIASAILAHAIGGNVLPQEFAAVFNIVMAGVICSALLLSTSLETGSRVHVRSIIVPVCLVGSMLSFGWMAAQISAEQTEQNLRTELSTRTLRAATAINPSDVAKLTGSPQDKDTGLFKQIRHVLRDIHAAYPDCRNAYITGIRQGRVVFLCNADAQSSANDSPPQHVYNAALDASKALGSKTQVMVEGPCKDQWGTWLSGGASVIMPDTNQQVAILVLDVDPTYWPSAVAASRLICLVATFLICALAIMFLYALHSARDYGWYISLSERRHRYLVENSPNSIEVFDEQGQYLSINAAGQSVIGLTQSELIGRSYVDVWPIKVRPLVADRVKQVLEGKKATFEAGYVSPSGRFVELYVVLNPIADDLGAIHRFMGISADITELKHAQGALASEKDRLSITLRSIGDGVIATDTDGKVMLLNKAAEILTGWSEAEAIGQPLASVFNIIDEQSGEPCKSPVDRMLETNGVVELSSNTSLIAKNGVVRNISDSGAPIRDKDGSISGLVIAFRDITERKVYGEKLNYLAHHDALTGLPNRMLFADRLAQGLARARRDNSKLVIMFFDLDRFKSVNDKMGHNTGDLLLKQVAGRMSDCLREADTIARMGGDEFTVILDNIETVEAAVEAAQRMLEALSQPMDLGGQECLISSSIGISIYPDNGLDAETLVKNADTAMYKAKENGRNGYFLYTEDLNAAALEKQTLENNLSKALERGELELYYQPQVAIRTGFPVGVEALARWHSQELGDISPNVFIPLAEETGLIIPIGEWVLRSACIQSKAWEDAGYAPRMVGVNISSRQFQQSDLVTSVSNILKETGLDPRRLNLEITESVLMQDPNHATQILHQLRKLGVLISLDDFGTGYSSLSYLKRFPIDVVKIDQSFVHDITHSAGDAAIACAVISLAHTLNLKVIAEGVETLEQLDFLRSLGCDEVQGYFVSPPIPPSEMDASMHSYQLERSEIGPLAA